MKKIKLSTILTLSFSLLLLVASANPFEGILRTAREERAALTSPSTFAPGFSLGSSFSYTKKRIGQSGIPIAASVGTTVALSLLFERFAKTESRTRAKKMAVLSYLLAAVYGSQLRQRGEQYNNLSLTDPMLFNRLLLVFGSSVCGTFLLNLVLDWYRGSKGSQATLKQNLTWALEMGALNSYAVAAAYFLDKGTVPVTQS